MYETKCLSVRFGDSAFGPGDQVSGLMEFLKNPEGKEAKLELFDEKGGTGQITLRVDRDGKIIVEFTSVNGLGFYLAEPR